MNSLHNKINRKIRSLRSDYVADRRFSKYLANHRMLSTIYNSFRLRKLSENHKEKYEQWVIDYLSNKLNSIITKYSDDHDYGEYVENAPVWICWWTGIETAPVLVKQCIKSIYKNSGQHTVHMITEKNYMQYIDVPEYMLQKVADGTMKLAHLADYIRVSLLEKYGGIWLDATIFCSQEISEDYFSKPFFTCKSDWQECGYISYMQWVTFVLGGWKGNLVYRFIKEAFEYYWSTENFAVDYLMFDYIIHIGVSKIPAFKKCIESNKKNNIHRDDLQAAFNARLSADQFDDVIKEDTELYKLSWRESYSLTTIDDKKSIYARFLELNI